MHASSVLMAETKTVVVYSHYNHILISVKYKGNNFLFNNALNTFYLWLYGVGYMVKDHSDSERKPTAAT